MCPVSETSFNLPQRALRGEKKIKSILIRLALQVGSSGGMMHRWHPPTGAESCERRGRRRRRRFSQHRTELQDPRGFKLVFVLHWKRRLHRRLDHTASQEQGRCITQPRWTFQKRVRFDCRPVDLMTQNKNQRDQ